ncbi:PAS domain S-box protein [Halorutilales archaeon Cl-col2-1]
MKLTQTEEKIEIILVEEESEFASKIRDDISEAGRFLFDPDYRLTHVETVSEARRRLEDSTDVVLLDIETGTGVGSFDSLDRLTDTDVPVVVLTDLTNKENAVEAIERGAQDYLDRKEVSPEALARSIRYAVERNTQRRELRRTKTKYESLFEGSPDPVILSDRTTGEIVEANLKASSLVGYSDHEIVGMNQSELHPDEERYKSLFERVKEDDSPVSEFEDGSQIYVVTADGERIPVEISVSEVGVDGRDLIYGVFRDISDRRDRESDLERYEDVVESLRVGVYRNTPGEEGDFIEVNSAMVDLFDADSEEELLETHVSDLYVDPEKRTELSDELMQKGYVEGREVRLRTLEGNEFWASVTATREFDTDGEVYFDGTLRDVTERKKRTRDLRRVKRVVDEAPISVSITDPRYDDNPIVYVNDRFTEITGYTKDEVVGRNCRFLQGDDTDDETVAEIREAIEDERPIKTEVLNYRKNGVEFWNELHIAPIYGSDGQLTNFAGFQIDVTDEVRRERRLERYHSLVENLPVGIYRKMPEKDGRLVEVNPALASIFGADSEIDLLGVPLKNLYSNVEDYDDFLTEIDSEGVATKELRMKTVDGDEFWAMMTAYQFESDEGETYIDGMVHDITERKEYERELEERNSELELLNRIVRHDIRNDMQVVLGMSQALEADIDDDRLDRVIENSQT